jgi:hypothetical protein
MKEKIHPDIVGDLDKKANPLSKFSANMGFIFSPLKKGENFDPEDLRLDHPSVVEFSIPWLAEVMPVFERPYHKKNTNEPHSDPIFGVYAHEPNGISYELIKLQILGHQLLTLLIWPRKNGHNRSIIVLAAERNISDSRIEGVFRINYPTAPTNGISTKL